MKYTVGREVFHNPYHAAVVRLQLTRNLGPLYSEMRDEVVTAFDQVLDLRGNGEQQVTTALVHITDAREDAEWKSVPALNAMQQIICRTSNRLFVGLPLCMYALTFHLPCVTQLGNVRS